MKPNIPDLVKKLSNGDEIAYLQLFEIFTPKIYRSSRRMCLRHEDAEEIVQEVFLRIWHHRQKLDSNLSFNAYVLTIMRSLIFKRTRKMALEIAYQQYNIIEKPLPTNPIEEEISHKELVDFSEKVIATLPKGQQEVINLKYQEHLSAEEIALRLHLSKRTVENQIYKATKNLKNHFLSKHIQPSDIFIHLIFFYINF